jgi:hypothetical protein
MKTWLGLGAGIGRQSRYQSANSLCQHIRAIHLSSSAYQQQGAKACDSNPEDVVTALRTNSGAVPNDYSALTKIVRWTTLLTKVKFAFAE